MKFKFNIFDDEYWKNFGRDLRRLTRLLDVKTDKAIVIEGVAINFCGYKEDGDGMDRTMQD